MRDLAAAELGVFYAPAVAYEGTMEPDLTIELINATVQIEQPSADGRRTVGTGFLVDAPTPDGRPRTVLVTAAHVFEQMPAPDVQVGWRFQAGDGAWRYNPRPMTIRVAGRPAYTSHPTLDIAVMAVAAPDAMARNAIPLSWLADERSFTDWGVGPGDEMMTVGYPLGQSSNRAGFPILRTGRVASWPLTPFEHYPTMLLDITVLGGNSGGPVFMASYGRRRPGTEQSSGAFIVGVLTKQLELEIGVVTHAVYVREAISLLDGPGLLAAPPGPNSD